jgi:hypothetical protein
MSGDLLEPADFPANSGQPFHLQKPFRISDVLALLEEIFSSSPSRANPSSE